MRCVHEARLSELHLFLNPAPCKNLTVVADF